MQYDGAPYCGWQRQPRDPSVQDTLERAIAALDPRRPLSVQAAGRTDTGVHAAAQVVHFDAEGPIPAQRWPAALNGRLPASIRVRAGAEVPPDWHACFSASYRRYRYTLYNARLPNLFLAPWSWHRYQLRLDEQLMRQALEGMLGEHDFAAFERAGSSRSHSRTTLQEVTVERRGDLIEVELQASGFLYGMVRLVMGQLVAVGEGRLSPEAFTDRWRAKLEEKTDDWHMEDQRGFNILVMTNFCEQRVRGACAARAQRVRSACAAQAKKASAHGAGTAAPRMAPAPRPALRLPAIGRIGVTP